MENGTAFFGRADSGGRIVIDGTSAQIYGGAVDSGGRSLLDADMTNSMRLTFIDLNAAKTNVEVDGTQI